MKSEKEKMLAGELYFAGDQELTNERLKARELMKKYNSCPEDKAEKLKSILKEFEGVNHGKKQNRRSNWAGRKSMTHRLISRY